MFNLTVLIVEDEADIRENLKKIVNRIFKVVIEAENGKIGLELFTSHEPDIIITDIRMPVMDGLEMISEIKKLRPKARIVVSTAFSDQEYFMKAIDLNIDKFIIKPIDVPLLKESLKLIAADILLYHTNQRLEKRMTLLMQSIMHSNDTIIILDLDKMVIFINQSFCKLFDCKSIACKRTSFIGAPFQDICADNRVLLDQIENLGDEGWVNEVELLNLDQTTFHSSVSISLIYNVDSSPSGYLLIFRNIDRRIELEAQLIKEKEIAEKSSQFKSEFLATMSYDIRTPVSSIIGMTNLMLEDPSISEANKEHLKIIDKSGKNLIRLTNDILDITKIENGKLVLEKIDFDLRQVCAFLEKLFSGQAREKKIFYKFEIDKTIEKFYIGDPYRLQQILINLISNAFKFTEHGHIIISIRKFKSPDSNRSLIKFNIIDSGKGVERSLQKSIFKSYNQKDTPVTREYAGTRLGITIAKNLVILMGGEINLISPAQTLIHPDGGSGSEFSFTTYFNNRAAEKTELSKGDKVVNIDPTYIKTFQNIGIKVLIAEDHPMNKTLIEKIMEALEIPYDSVENGREAIKAVNGDNYTVIFMDVEMPVMGGIEATRKIRENGNNIPIVACTSHGFHEEIEKCLIAGINRYIIKPVSKQVIIETLINLITEEQHQV